MATLTLTVAASTDDANLNDGGYTDSGGTLLVGACGSSPPANSGQGWRFLSVALGAADTINSAQLSMLKSAAAWNDVDWRLTTIAQDNTATFSSGSPPGSRAIVSASIAAETLNVNRADATVYAFPSTSPLRATFGAAIAAVLARGGWASGNALAVVNESAQDAGRTASLARETYHAWDSATASSEPQLVIDYTAAPADVDQEGARFRADDGSETTATWAAAQDAGLTTPAGSALRLRLLLNSPADPGAETYRLDYKLSTDSVYAAVAAAPTGVLAYGAEGAVAVTGSNSTTVDPAYPTGITAESVLLMVVGSKPVTAQADEVTTPSGWTLVGSTLNGGGYGATIGTDTGNSNLYVFAKDTVAGTETGTVAVAVVNTSTTGVAWAQILRLQPDGPVTPGYAAASADRTTTPTSPLTLTFGSDPGVAAGDFVIAAFCIPTDVTTPAQFSSPTFSQTGVTFSGTTEVSEPDSSAGRDIGGVVVRAAAASGTSSAAPSLQLTLAGTLTNVRGPAVFLRVRGTPVLAPVRLNPSANIAAGAATNTTAQLTPPSGKTTADFTAGKISDDTNPLPSIDVGSNDYTELEWSIVLDAGATNGNAYDFRVTKAGTALASYAVTPQLTVGTAGVAVAPSAASGGAVTVAPTAVKGSIATTPAAAAAAATVVAPTVLKGSTSATPAPSAAAAATVAPTVTKSSTSATPTPASAAAAAQIGAVVHGSLSLTPTAGAASATTVNPAVVAGGNVVLTPTAASASATTVNPTAVKGSLALTPTASAAGATTVAPAVLTGSTSATPPPASAVAAAVNPAVVQASLAPTPSPAAAAAATTPPSVVAGSLAVAPTGAVASLASVNPTVAGGGLQVAPASAAGALASVAPAVLKGAASATPTPATASATTVAPAVVLGSLALSPPSATAAAATSGGAVVLGSLAFVPSIAGATLSTSVSVAGGGLQVTPTASSASAVAVAPSVVKGSLSTTPTASSAVAVTTGATALKGSTSAVPAPATVAASSSATVVQGGLALTPAVATASATALSPAVTKGALALTGIASAAASTVVPSLVLTSTTAAPAPASAVAGTAGPTVLVIDPTPVFVGPTSALIGDIGRYLAAATDTRTRAVVASGRLLVGA